MCYLVLCARCKKWRWAHCDLEAHTEHMRKVIAARRGVDLCSCVLASACA